MLKTSWISIFFIIGLLIYSSQYSSISLIEASTQDGQSPSTSDNLEESALANLGAALQKDKLENPENSKNWDSAIENLEEKLGFQIDDDFEDALKNITTVYLNEITVS